MDGFAETEKIGRLLRANKRLARKLSRIETLFDAIQAAIVVISGDGSIRFANAFAKNLLPVGAASSIYKIIPGIESAIEAVSKDGNVAVRREFEIDYPERKLLSAQVIPFDYGDDSSTFAVLISDITKEKLSTQEKIENEKIASVLNLASGVAHELGNPLNSIGIHLQLVKRRLSKLEGLFESNRSQMEEISESVEICSSEVARLNAIIENFLKALRPMKPDMRECDPIKPLAETLKILDHEILDMNVGVYVNTDTPMPKVFADENLLKQLYFNILKNAMESMKDGGRINIVAKGDDEFVKISFSDTGCGMDEDHMAKLFTPYFTTKPTGHGLGMTIIASIVRAHGGKIDVESRSGKGTTISVFIPRKERRVKMLEA